MCTVIGMGKLEAYARGLIETRMVRMVRLIAAKAPDSLVASEAIMIGDAAVLLDPALVIQRTVAHKLELARTALGLCQHPDCDVELAKAGHDEPVFCVAHEDQIERMVREAGDPS